MIKRLIWALSVASASLATGTIVQADCAIIARLDNLHSIQSRLARDPDTALFANDIRQIRALSQGLGFRAAAEAVDGNSFTGHGADVVRFLQNTQALLQRASLDDPQSVRAHFDRQRLDNLQRIAGHLPDLRCTAIQIAVDAERATARGRNGADRDAEDLAEVAQTLTKLTTDIFRPATFVIIASLVGAVMLILPLVQRHLQLRKRRAKRHNTTYDTQYHWNGHKTAGMLIDINCFGVKLRHGQVSPLPVGSRVEIRIVDTTIQGAVIWSNTHYSGIQFRSALPLNAVETVIATEQDAPKKNGAPQDAVSQ